MLAAVDSMAEQMRARDRAMVGILQQYSYRVFTEILTPVQVCLTMHALPCPDATVGAEPSKRCNATMHRWNRVSCKRCVALTSAVFVRLRTVNAPPPQFRCNSAVMVLGCCAVCECRHGCGAVSLRHHRRHPAYECALNRPPLSDPVFVYAWKAWHSTGRLGLHGDLDWLRSICC